MAFLACRAILAFFKTPTHLLYVQRYHIQLLLPIPLWIAVQLCPYRSQSTEVTTYCFTFILTFNHLSYSCPGQTIYVHFSCTLDNSQDSFWHSIFSFHTSPQLTSGIRIIILLKIYENQIHPYVILHVCPAICLKPKGKLVVLLLVCNNAAPNKMWFNSIFNSFLYYFFVHLYLKMAYL